MADCYCNSSGITVQNISDDVALDRRSFDNVTGLDGSQMYIPKKRILGPDIDSYFTICIVTIGSIGNALSIVAVTSRHNNQASKRSFYVYVLALALIDTLSLYSMNLEKVSSQLFNISIQNYNTATCKLIKYFEEVLPHISSWIIVCLTVERCLCTTLVHRFGIISRPKAGYKVVATISVILILLNLHLLVGFDLFPEDNVGTSNENSSAVCSIENEVYSDFFFYFWNWISLCVYCLIPFLIIMSANTITVIQVYRSARLVRKASSIGIRRRIQRLMFETLLVSMSFILLGMPEPLLEVWKFEEVGTAVDRDLLALKTNVLTIIFQQMRTLNHAVNFWLYVLSGKQFRQSLRSALCQSCKKLQTDPERQIRLFTLRSYLEALKW